MSNATKLEFSASDTVGVVLGDRRSGKSTLCNRLCTNVDFPQDGREVADVLDNTSEPRVYNLKNSKHGKILDVPGYRSEGFPDEDMASFAARNHFHRADYVIVVYSHRALPPNDIITWCKANEKPMIAVINWTQAVTRLMMREEKCSQSEIQSQMRDYVRYVAKDLRGQKIPFFAVDTKQWHNAIKAYGAGDYDAARLHYGEGELLKLVARAGQAESTPGGSVSAVFESHAERESKIESENYPVTHLETVLLDVHVINQTRMDSPISADCGVVSVQTQTELPPRTSRAVRLSPTFFQ